MVILQACYGYFVCWQPRCLLNVWPSSIHFFQKHPYFLCDWIVVGFFLEPTFKLLAVKQNLIIDLPHRKFRQFFEKLRVLFWPVVLDKVHYCSLCEVTSYKVLFQGFSESIGNCIPLLNGFFLQDVDLQVYLILIFFILLLGNTLTRSECGKVRVVIVLPRSDYSTKCSDFLRLVLSI